jgi:peptidylprolyl isomerase
MVGAQSSRTRDAAASENSFRKQDNTMTQAAKAGDTLRIHYTGRLEDGTIFDKSEVDAPLEFTTGTGDVIPGLDQGVIGMATGETRELTIAPDEAYGKRDETRVQTVPLEAVPDHIPTELGTQLQIQTQDGQTLPVVVSDKTDSNVELDANHPLAGKTLIFDVTLVEIT